MNTHSAFSNNQVRVFALCLDSIGMERAQQLHKKLAGNRLGSRGVQAQTWKLSTAMAPGPLRAIIAEDAAKAEILIIACSALDQREPLLTEWLGLIGIQKQAQRSGGLLVGLFGDEGREADELAWIVGLLGDFGRRTGMQLLWQWMAEDMHSTDLLEEDIAVTWKSVFGFRISDRVLKTDVLAGSQV